MKSKNSSALVAKYGMLIALAFILSYVEAMIPPPIPIPGVKLGLANLVTVVGLYTVGVKGTVAVSLTRIVLVGFTFSNMFTMVYGLAGGAVSLLLMIVSRRWFTKIGVSVIGGVGHNLGQLLVAAIVVKTAGVFYYFPALLIAGTISGGLVGLLGAAIVKRIGAVTNYS